MQTHTVKKRKVEAVVITDILLYIISTNADPTFTAVNITGAMEIVTEDTRRQVWETVLRETVKDIYCSHSSEEERLQYCAHSYTAKSESSWEDLVGWLYFHGEMAAAKKAKAFLQQKGESQLVQGRGLSNI